MMGTTIFRIAVLALAALAWGEARAAAPAIIAHRGGALLWPENTLHAFQHAEAESVEYLEMDLQLTADDRLLVTHDETINPRFCDGGSGPARPGVPVRTLTLEQSRAITCGQQPRPLYPDAETREGLHMPALEEVFEAFKDNARLRYFIETKMPKAGTPGATVDVERYTQALEALVRRYGLEQRVVLQSFDWRTLQVMHALNPRIRTCPLGVPKKRRDYLQLLRELQATCIVLGLEETTAAEVAQLREHGVLVFSGVVDKEADWRGVVDLGFDALFTNDPRGAAIYLRRQRSGSPRPKAL